MKKNLIILLGIVLSLPLPAQVTSSTFDPAWAGRLQASMTNSVNNGITRGISAAVWIPGQGTFIGVAGESTPGVPITPDMQFCVGSNSKLFTAVILLKLQELGVLSLDDPISDWLPAFPHINPATTIRQLLVHQSGIFDFETEIDPHENFFENMNMFVYGPPTFYTPEDVLAMIGPPHFNPGEKFGYSNTNYLLAAMIIESATGQSFVNSLHQYILDPHGLNKIFVGAYESPNGTVANAWHLGDDIGNVPTVAPHSMYVGSGSIFSTANDMVNWYKKLFSGQVVSQASLNELTNFEGSNDFGISLINRFWRIGNTGHNLWTFEGWVPGYTSDLLYDLKTGTVIAMMSNDENEREAFVPILIEVFNNYPRKVNDAGIEYVVTPAQQKCAGPFNPLVRLINYGTATLSTATIKYQLDGGTIQSFHWTGSLVTGASTVISLPSIAPGNGAHKFRSYTTNPNGASEGYTYNDTADSRFVITSAPFPNTLNEGFEGPVFPPAGWLTADNPAGDWKSTSLSVLHGNKCAVKHNWFDVTLRSYDLELPLMDLSSMTNPVLSFKYAYSYYGQGFNDGLAVLVSTDCGATYQSAFNKAGASLTTADTTERFYPNDDQWRLKALNLSAHKNSSVMIKFRAINAKGNNLFLDNVSIEDKSEICPSPTNLDALQITSSSAKLNWQFNGGASQFEVYYKPEGGSYLSKVVAGNRKWVIINNLLPDTDYDWYIVAICSTGSSLLSEVSLFRTEASDAVTEVTPITEDGRIPAQPGLSIFPNPVTGATALSFYIPDPGMVSINVFDINGRLIKSLSNKNWNEGTHQLSFETGEMKNGIYILRLQTKSTVQTRKFVVQR